MRATGTAPGLLELIGRTPLVPLRRLSVPVLVKCEHLNPGGSVKDRLALAIVDDAEARGVLAPGVTLVEATASNTGVGLALVAASRGHSLVCVMPEKMSVDKRAPSSLAPAPAGRSAASDDVSKNMSPGSASCSPPRSGRR